MIVQKSDKLAHGLPEALAPLIVSLVKDGGFTHVVGAHTALGKNAFPRAAALLDVAQVGPTFREPPLPVLLTGLPERARTPDLGRPESRLWRHL